MFRLIPLKIHVWGGLGSQLYAWALAELISQRKKRKVVLVLHSGGVTRRTSEIDFLKSRFQMRHVDDYIKTDSTPRQNISLDAKHSFKRLLLYFRVVMNDESLRKNPRILPWTLSLRGHYTKVFLPTSIIKGMITLANEQGLLISKEDTSRRILIHYRLGDLQFLEGKAPLPAIRFERFRALASEVLLESDSEQLAVKLLSETLDISVKSLNSKSAWEVLANILSCDVFIGTPSKLSFWGIAFRQLSITNSINYMTLEHVHHIKNLVGDELVKNVITF